MMRRHCSFFVELMHPDFKIDLKVGDENEKIKVIRWQFPLLQGMLRTACSVQGLTLDGGLLVDLRRAGGLEDDDLWLAMYVKLTRTRKLQNLILLGFTSKWRIFCQRCCHVGALAELACV